MTALFATSGASGAAVGVATVTAATDTLTIADHDLVDGEQVVTASPDGGADGVLVPGAPYYVANVAGDDFQLRYAPGSPVVAFETDGEVTVDRAAAVYTGQQLRQALGGLLYKSRPTAEATATGRFGARAGVIANSSADAVTHVGLTVTVADTNIVINPVAGGTQGGPYLCAIPTASHVAAAADATNNRIDLLAGRIRDTAEDVTGFIVADTYLIPGTPAPIATAPDLPPGEFELARFTVPSVSSGTPPSLAYAPEYTVAAGGILPVANTSALTLAVRREGMYADVASTDTLVRYSGSTYQPVASVVNHSYVSAMTSSPQAVGWNIYTPTVAGQGSATFSTLTGRWKRIAPLTVCFIVYLVVSSAGSGSANFTVTAPTAINRATRQVVEMAVEGASGGSGGNRAGQAVSFTGGSGAVWDRLRMDNGTTPNLNNMTGTMLASGMFLTVQGSYQEEE
ncbi:hypothetical protein AB0B28_08115 [Glycomyces sp. NPDC046736]|uniref:hypothetical protein n=1 Tax=Glycomyces sp. NPDC046736 TaxID=3155615 RepID=UPI0033F38CDB